MYFYFKWIPTSNKVQVNNFNSYFLARGWLGLVWAGIRQLHLVAVCWAELSWEVSPVNQNLTYALNFSLGPALSSHDAPTWKCQGDGKGLWSQACFMMSVSAQNRHPFCNGVVSSEKSRQRRREWFSPCTTICRMREKFCTAGDCESKGSLLWYLSVWHLVS